MSSWILTASNKKFDFVDVKPENICLGDIAQGLSRICRFNGQIETFYSVARHCLNMATYASCAGYDDLVVKQCLLHDASEAYTGDMVSPLKALCPDFKAIEKTIQKAIYVKYGLPEDTLPLVKELDIRIMITEKQWLFREDALKWEWEDDVEPLDMLIYLVNDPGILGSKREQILRLNGIHHNYEENLHWTQRDYYDTAKRMFKDE